MSAQNRLLRKSCAFAVLGFPLCGMSAEIPSRQAAPQLHNQNAVQKPEGSALGFASDSAAENLEGILKFLGSIKGLSIPIGPDVSNPTMIFSCGSIAVERKSVGFFRIGVLPEVILSDVKIRILNSPDPQIWAKLLAGFLEFDKPLPIKVRNLKIETRDGDSHFFAKEAYIKNVSRKISFQEVSLAIDNAQYNAPIAEMQLAGPALGQIKLGQPDRTFNITESYLVICNNKYLLNPKTN